ncbi:hypothetical protein KZ483_06595 [Paenibacillus sp. sptzw28]|uniref:hypothetical protein n=1 Tax=Paenibacillus sp. sptzw28 TaxID=715179 RepID=UPI001C6F5D63|nr:hypothetical protein [Paenibacillus sp. sptzw28]QYR22624.1 hypothetical protein KZ483_06595 [Paenibacillus sp. sptzw28]
MKKQIEPIFAAPSGAFTLHLMGKIQVPILGNFRLQLTGMINAAKERGYTAYSYNFSNPTYSTVKGNIYNVGPTLLSYLGQTYYGDHTVTGIGYQEFFYNGSSYGHQYMTVHDNWGSTPEKVYVAYGRNYTSLYSVTFSM